MRKKKDKKKTLTDNRGMQMATYLNVQTSLQLNASFKKKIF